MMRYAVMTATIRSAMIATTDTLTATAVLEDLPVSLAGDVVCGGYVEYSLETKQLLQNDLKKFRESTLSVLFQYQCPHCQEKPVVETLDEALCIMGVG
jgi:hypothetical protein